MYSNIFFQMLTPNSKARQVSRHLADMMSPPDGGFNLLQSDPNFSESQMDDGLGGSEWNLTRPHSVSLSRHFEHQVPVQPTSYLGLRGSDIGLGRIGGMPLTVTALQKESACSRTSLLEDDRESCV